MITTIQAVESRLKYIKPIVEEFNAIVFVDYKKRNAFWSFKDMLDIEFDDYRFHIQDDVILADGLKNYLPDLCGFMKDKNIQLLSLFAPARKSLSHEYFIGKRITPYRNYLGNMGVIFSKKFVDDMRIYVNISSQTIDDDVFIEETLSRTGTKAFVHLPALVQHDLGIDSILGHDTSVIHSNLFEKDFLKK